MASFRAFCEDPSNHAPRPASAAGPVAAGDTDVPSVFDSLTGRVRVMGDKCTTCIGRRGTPLSDERRRELLGLQPDGSYDERWTVCHQTLPDNPGNPGDLPPAVCAWIAQHPLASARSLAMRIGAAQGIDCISPQPKP
ncbi:hypothetical protein AB0M32_09630 [Streptomyces sp. NPDC051985]|uniref:hypothetical protein n=1 Tax=Streptomyces sp. NPDC051985 TaxID=3155807 RepID=UPI00344331EF